MERTVFFECASPIVAYQGDTFPRLGVYIFDMDISNCTMRVDIEDKYRPGVVVMSRQGILTTRVSDNAHGFRFQLDSTDTAQLNGMYIMHFVLTDEDDLDYRKLIVPLEIIPSPQEVG